MVRNSTRQPRVAVIHPRLDGQGGLEKYGVHVIEELARRLPVDVISEHEVDLQVLERAFHVSLQGPRFICDQRCESHIQPTGRMSDRVARWKAEHDYQSLTAQYDLIVGQTVGLPYRSGARRSVLLCHFPVVREQKIDRRVPSRGWRSLLSSEGRQQRTVRGRLDSWTRIIANSQFTAGWVQNYWDRVPDVINPPIELPEAADLSVKKQWIIGAGFFGRPDAAAGEKWSYKRQELLIDEFRRLCDQGLRGWELHLAGHVLPPTPEVYAYVGELRKRAENYPVFLHPSCPRVELLDLYRHGSIFWHATGYGIDPQVHPERTEHFGMVTAEAMGWGCVPVAINSGGQPEIVEHNRSGYLWSTLEELREFTTALIESPSERLRLGAGAVQRAQDFGMRRFRRQVEVLVDEELGHL